MAKVMADQMLVKLLLAVHSNPFKRRDERHPRGDFDPYRQGPRTSRINSDSRTEEAIPWIQSSR